MKRQSNWVVTAGKTLKGKQHTIVYTRQAFKDRKNEKMEVFSSNHVSIEEKEEVPQLEDAQEAPTTFEEGNQGTIDELKQVNLGTE